MHGNQFWTFSWTSIPYGVYTVGCVTITSSKTSRHQGILKATVSGVNEDLKFKISEALDQNWSCPESALVAVSV